MAECELNENQYNLGQFFYRGKFLISRKLSFIFNLCDLRRWLAINLEFGFDEINGVDIDVTMRKIRGDGRCII